MAREHFNWNDLRVFLAVARLGSMAQAADYLGVTHSTIFRRISSLEKAMGVRLFARLPEGYQLTSTGYDILRHAERVGDRINELLRVLDARDQSLSGVIKVTAPHNLAYSYLPNYLYEFQQQYSEIKVHLIVSNANLDLSRREADLAIRATPTPPDHLIGHHLFSLSWAAYAAPNYLTQHGIPCDSTDFTNHRFISAHTEQFKLPAFEWLEHTVDEQQIIARCSDLVSMSALAVTGLAIAILPDDQAKPQLQRLFTVPEIAASQLWLLTHPDLRDNRKLRIFKEFLISRFAQESVFQQYGHSPSAIPISS